MGLLVKMLPPVGLIITILFSAVLVQITASSIGQNYSLVLVGGGLLENNTDVWETIILLGGGKKQARFGVVSAASEDPCCDKDSSFVYYDALLRAYGAAEVYYIPVTVDSTENNGNQEVIATIKTLTGFFFGGGDQLRIIESFYNQNSRVPSPVLLAIKETAQKNQGVIAGTSAGTDCQTQKVMITGGASYEALLNGAKTLWYPAESPDVTTLTAYGLGGIGNFPHGLLDTHFANRGRHGRLIELLVDTSSMPLGSTRAYGVDENTALVVTGDWSARSGTVIGQRAVWIFDSSRVDVSSVHNVEDDQKKVHISGIAMSRIANGDTLNLNTYEVKPAYYKVPVVSSSNDEPLTSEDIFSEGTFEMDTIALSLFQSTHGVTYGLTNQTDPAQLIVHIGKNWKSLHSSISAIEKDVTATAYEGTDPSTGVYSYGFQNLWLSVDSFKELK